MMSAESSQQTQKICGTYKVSGRFLSERKVSFDGHGRSPSIADNSAVIPGRRLGFHFGEDREVPMRASTASVALALTSPAAPSACLAGQGPIGLRKLSAGV